MAGGGIPRDVLACADKPWDVVSATPGALAWRRGPVCAFTRVCCGAAESLHTYLHGHLDHSVVCNTHNIGNNNTV